MADPDIRVRIGLRIKHLRAEAHLTQGILSSSIGLSRSYLAEVETGRRNVSAVNIERICAARRRLRCSLSRTEHMLMM